MNKLLVAALFRELLNKKMLRLYVQTFTKNEIIVKLYEYKKYR